MITASTPLRSASACHSSSASPTRRAASERVALVTRARELDDAEPHWISYSSISGFVSSRSHISPTREGSSTSSSTSRPDVHVAHALEAERGQGALDGLALRIQDPGLGPDQDPHPQGAVRSSHAENGSPASRSYAVT